MLSLLRKLLCLFALYHAIKHAMRKTVAVPTRGAVLITGVSSGIGRHAAVTLAHEHPHLTVVGTVRKEADIAPLQQACPACVPLIMDVANETSVVAGVAALDTLLAARGSDGSTPLPLVGLVNNAGISRRLPIELEPLAAVRRVFEVNYFGMFALTQALLPALRAAGREPAGGGARVVNIGSVAGLVAPPMSGTYSGTKYALEAFTMALRREVSAFGMAVSVVNPAYVATAIAGKQLGKASSTAGLKAAQRALYAHVLEGHEEKRARAEARADGPEVTTAAIVHALTSPHPRARYVVANVNGIPAWIVSWALWAFPEDVVDKLLTAAQTTAQHAANSEL